VKPYYQDDLVTIYHGDALSAASLTGVDCVVTSPPYNTLGTRIPSRPTGMHARSGWLAKVSAVGYADDMDEAAYAEWQCAVAVAVGAACRSGASWFYNHKPRLRDKTVLHPLEIVRQFADWPLRQELIWARPGAVAFNARVFASSDERIYWMVHHGAAHKWNQVAASWMSVWSLRPDIGNPHPAPFPVELATRCIAATTDEGDTVLDPFMGSGTTIVAAKSMNRHAIGIELDERWCEVAANRCRQEVLGLTA
jgi:site-specific DNA-methyltransferase (adenine-specific)